MSPYELEEIKLQLDEKMAVLGLKQDLRWVAHQVLVAYSDRHGGLPIQRNLAFFCRTPVNGSQLIGLMSKLVHLYNEFDGEKTTAKLVEHLGEDANYFIARERSVAIYVKPVRQIELWKVNLATLADEASFEPELNMFRFWWD